jgi:hypothetical protein
MVRAARQDRHIEPCLFIKTLCLRDVKAGRLRIGQPLRLQDQRIGGLHGGEQAKTADGKRCQQGSFQHLAPLTRRAL